MLKKFKDAIKWILSTSALAIAYFQGRRSKENDDAKAEIQNLKKQRDIAARPRASITDIRDWMRDKN